MKTIRTIFLAVTLSMIYHPTVSAQNSLPSFTASSPFSLLVQTQPLKILSINGSITKKKVILNWTVSENEEADQFAVERSMNGKTFVMAALVFGTCKADTDNYRFYEKTKKLKIYYRIKIVGNNGSVGYSPVIIAGTDPTATK